MLNDLGLDLKTSQERVGVYRVYGGTFQIDQLPEFLDRPDPRTECL